MDKRQTEQLIQFKSELVRQGSIDCINHTMRRPTKHDNTETPFN